MQADFWHERWEKGEIGFHQADYNQYMQDFIERLGVRPGAQILAPLCGKSLDMLWLAEQGYCVTGIEISELAVKDFFVENSLSYHIDRGSGVDTFRGEQICILCTDFFSLEKQDLPAIDAVYDRAALVALPPDMRQDYARHLAQLMESEVRSLLVTLDYPTEQMRGPPFSVTAEEVRQLFSEQYCVESLHAEDCLAREPRFRKKGLTYLTEQVYLLQKK